MAPPWSEAEDINLCRSYLNVSEDSIVGTDQTSAKLWQRVFTKFEELRIEQRMPLYRDKPSQLQNRWAGRIKPDVALFCNVLAQVFSILFSRRPIVKSYPHV